ncbi:MAG: uracil-DNA glycosylase [Bdellovibrio sp.]
MQIEQSYSQKSPLPESWMKYLGPEFDSTYMNEIRSFLAAEIKKGKTIYPHGSLIFNAFHLTPLDQVKVVVVGQDPYHGEGQAHGLSFSVRPGVQIPPSLQNIYKELHADMGIAPVKHGHLEKWAKQGVLLLNAVLTVEANQAASHANKGWEKFTDKVIEVLNREREHVVFFLWGAYAQKKGASIDRKKHLVIESPHPSPFSAHRGFFGTKPFSRANSYLSEHHLAPIDWSLAD